MRSRAHRPRRPSDRARQTRAAIMDAVRELLAEGRFQEATVEQVAERAGVSRATVYQHFRSRTGLIDAICDTIGEAPEFVALIRSLDLPDARDALRSAVTHSARFLAAEEGLHRHLYGLAEFDPAAAAFVTRQTQDRRRALLRLLQALQRQGSLRQGLSTDEAMATLLLLTSPRTFNELRQSTEMSPERIGQVLSRIADETLLTPIEHKDRP